MIDPLSPKIMADPNSGCWLWVGAASGGYGQTSYEGRVQYVHRVSWEQRHGEIRDDLKVLHKCDTPACCNPNHLFLGTTKDNSDDMRAKGRHVSRDRRAEIARRTCAKGEKHGNVKLTDAQVLAILSDPRASETVGPDYGVSGRHVRCIRQRKTRLTISPTGVTP